MLRQADPPTAQVASAGNDVQIFAGIILAALAALAVRIYGLNDLHLSGDSAYSVFVANQPLAALTVSRLADGHPPLYYYVLHFWLRIVGTTEFTARLPSVFMGVMLAPVAYRLTRTLAGTAAGIIAAWLVALSPDLVFHGRLARMYSLLPLAVTVSWLLFERALRRPGRAWVSYVAVTTVALFTHYYAVAGVAAQGIYLLAWSRGTARRRGLISLAMAGAIFAPWLLWATPSQARVTADILADVPAAEGLLGFLELVWLPFQAGVLVDVATGRALAALMALVFLTALVSGCLRAERSAGIRMPAVATGLPIVFSLAAFAVAPIAVRPRFLLVALPFLLVVFGILLARVRPRGLAAALLSAVLVADAYALAVSYQAERGTLEEDAVQLAEHLDRWGRAGDVAALHAAWEIGYLRAHPPAAPVRLLELNDLTSSLSDGLGTWRRVWLASYNEDPRRLPAGAYLEKHWARADEWSFGPTQLALYVAPPTAPGSTVSARFLDQDERPDLVLASAALPSVEVPAGEDVSVRLDWLAELPPSNRLTAFVHLVSAAGERIAGHDVEPGRESYPTHTWPAGERVADAHAFRVPLDAPAGEYDVVVGLYTTGGGERLRIADGSGRDSLSLGRVRVGPPVVRPAHALAIPVGPLLTVTGLTTDLDRFAVGERRLMNVTSAEVRRLVTRKTFYKPGETGEVDLHWLASLPSRDPLTLRAIGPDGVELVATAGRPNTGTAGVSLFRLTWPDDATPGAYALFVGHGEYTAPVGTARLGR